MTRLPVNSSFAKSPLMGFVVIAVILAVAPFALGTQDYQLTQDEYVLALIVVAMGLNVVFGFAGQLSLGPGAVFAVSGYTCVLLASHFPSWFGFPAMALTGLVIGVVTGLIIGWPALRVSGFYLGMSTLFVALLVPNLASDWSVTGAASGISLASVARWQPGIAGLGLYEVLVVIVLSVVALTFGIKRSRIGRRFAVIKTSDELAVSLGINDRKEKLLAFAVSSALGGLGACLYVYSQQFMSPSSATLDLSIYLLAACVIGGLGTVTGPVIGGVFVFGLTNALGALEQYQGIIFGVILLGCVLARPEGLLSIRLPEVRRRYSPGLRTGASSGEVMSQPAGGRETATSGISVKVPLAPNGVELEQSDVASVGALRISSATRSFGGVRAVDDVTVTVRAGEIHGLVGSNGSGKTTLLNLISGYYSLDAGTIWLGERRLDGAAKYEVARSGLARTFQTPKLVDVMSILDNVMVAVERRPGARADAQSVARLPSGRRAEAEARSVAMDALEMVGLANECRKLAAEMPHGTRRLVEVARAVAQNPRCLLLDEPAAGLGPGELEDLYRAIVEVSHHGVAVLLVEHNIPFVVDVASRVTALHRGRVLLTGPPQILDGNAAIAEAFLGSLEPIRSWRP